MVPPVPQLRPRYIAGRRIHHGLVGEILIIIGLWLLIDDWKDRWWALSKRL